MIRTIHRFFQRAHTKAAGPKSPTAVRPGDATEAHATGPDPVHVVLAGGDILTGWGVRTHDLALPGHLARTLSAATGRGVDVAVALEPHITSKTLLPLLHEQRLDVADAVVIHLGLTDLQLLTPPTRWTADLVSSISYVQQHTNAGAMITIMGISAPSRLPYLHTRGGGILDQHAAVLNRATEVLCHNTPGVVFLPAPVYATDASAGRRFGGPDHFQHWASHQTANLHPHLPHTNPDTVPPAGRSPYLLADTKRRMNAIHQLTWNTDTDTRVEKIIRQAKALFDVDTVLFAIATTDELVPYLHVGGPVINVPLEQSFCWNTLQQTGTLIIRDTWADDPTRRRYKARFYAGHPVLAPDGTPIGTLCLLAERPPSDEVDCVLLRDLTLQIQQALSTPALATA